MLMRLGIQLLHLHEGGADGIGLVRIVDEDHVQVLCRDGKRFSITKDGETVSMVMASPRGAAGGREADSVYEELLALNGR
ncbi:hypothetical protein [Nitrospira sp. Kam-Ns4a]